MKYVLLIVVGALAGLEYWHERTSGELPGASVCLGPQATHEALRDVLLQHMQSHR